MEASGRYVSFQSHANNLVSGDTNGFVDVFVRDRSTGLTTRESVGPAGLQSRMEISERGARAENLRSRKLRGRRIRRTPELRKRLVQSDRTADLTCRRR